MEVPVFAEVLLLKGEITGAGHGSSRSKRRSGFRSGWLVCRRHNNGEKDTGEEGRDCEDEQGQSSHARSFLPHLIDLILAHMGVFLEVWVRVNLPDVGRRIEQEREPSNPSCELNLTNPRDLRWKAANRPKQVLEEAYQTTLRFWCSFHARIALRDSGAAYRYGNR